MAARKLLFSAALMGAACAPTKKPPTQPSTAHTKDHRHHGGHHRFDDAEEWAKQFDDPARDAWQRPDDVIAWMKLAPTMTVADLGAGTGYFAVRLAKVVTQGIVLANDVEPDMVRYLGERAAKMEITNLVPVTGTAQDPKLGRATDVALMCDVYHHIEDRQTFFANLSRDLAGGRLIIVDFKKDAAPDAPGPPPAMRIASTQVIAQLEPLGYTVTRQDQTTLPHQYMLEFSVATPAP